jgi:hypothetical protein
MSAVAQGLCRAEMASAFASIAMVLPVKKGSPESPRREMHPREGVHPRRWDRVRGGGPRRCEVRRVREVWRGRGPARTSPPKQVLLSSVLSARLASNARIRISRTSDVDSSGRPVSDPSAVDRGDVRSLPRTPSTRPLRCNSFNRDGSACNRGEPVDAFRRVDPSSPGQEEGATDSGKTSSTTLTRRPTGGMLSLWPLQRRARPEPRS